MAKRKTKRSGGLGGVGVNANAELRKYAKTSTRAFLQTIKAVENGDCAAAQKHYVNGQKRYGVAYGFARATAGRKNGVNVTPELERAGAAMQPARDLFKSGCKITRR